jgi:oligopeptide transport system ATP-binding protein
MIPAENLLEVKNLTTHFHTQGGIVRAVNDVSFQIAAGETVGVVGESGCGKSVTMRSIMRLIPEPPGKIAAGEVLFEGRDLLKLPEEAMRKIRGQEIAMIFQDPMTSLNPVLTVGRQLTESLEEHFGSSHARAEARAIELLDLVGIPDAANRLSEYPHQFSGGMRQRVMIAMALSCDPKLIIADEPTTALDVTIQAQIIELINRLQAEMGMAVIWITHDLAVVARLAQRVLVMYAGRIVESAPMKSLFADPGHPYTMGLLASLPRLDADKDIELQVIPGQPPNQVALPVGCPFAPRCAYTVDRCIEENPPLERYRADHWAACWEKEKIDSERAMAR